jgi:hypothetical protein
MYNRIQANKKGLMISSVRLTDVCSLFTLEDKKNGAIAFWVRFLKGDRPITHHQHNNKPHPKEELRSR